MTEHRSTSRVLDILEYIAEKRDEKMNLANISRFLNAPKSSLFPILQTLVARKYLNYDEDSHIYSIGSMCYQIGVHYINDGNLSQDIDKILTHITEESQETCYFAELDGSEVLYLNRKDSSQSIRTFSQPGKRLPAYATGLGKALLCEKSLAELNELYPKGLNPITKNTITDINKLYEQLQEFKQSGFAYEVEESSKYIRCIAVSIHSNSKVRYALSVAIPVFRYTQKTEKLVKDLLSEAKKEIESKLAMELR